MNDTISHNSFDTLLSLLDTDRERAGEKYEDLRVRLIKLFDWRGCTAAEELADVCFDRVLKKIRDGEQIQNIHAYAVTIAQFVVKEHLRDFSRFAETTDGELARDLSAESNTNENGDERMSCLEQCLTQFRDDDRELIVSYYDTDEKTMIAARKRLADRLAVSLNTLRIKVCRLKAKLEKCTKDCCEHVDASGV